MRKRSQLIKGLDKLEEESRILLCFPYAGGGASIFHSWKKELFYDVKVCPIQLPGREERIIEEPYTNVEKLTDDILCCLAEIDNDIILFGHSMGAKIAYSVAVELEKKYRGPKLLIVSGSTAPNSFESDLINGLNDEEFKNRLMQFEGTPKEILENKELLNFFMPMLRADFTMNETCKFKDVFKLKCPILALRGDEDKEVTQNDLYAWRTYTDNNKFECVAFHGNHFYIRSEEKILLQWIRKKIIEYV